MHYIDMDEVELDLPDDWDDIVNSAWHYVNRKTEQAVLEVINNPDNNGLDAIQLERKINLAKDNARKKAISSKSDVWGRLSEILSKQSTGKCWYCESNELRSDNPIDHFRPKGRVAECIDHPGYWWLAFDWRNYRFACTYCNSKRINVDTAGGKQDHFPIFTPPEWKKSADDPNIERPKLLDPTDPDDYKLLTFNKNGEASPNTQDEDTDNYQKAVESIKNYHLNHSPTKIARKQIWQKIRQIVANTNDLLEHGLDMNVEQIKSNKRELIKMIRPSCRSSKFNSAAKLYLREHEGFSWVKEILDRD